MESALETDEGEEDAEKCTEAGGRSEGGSEPSDERRKVNAQGILAASCARGLSRTRTSGESSVEDDICGRRRC